MITFFGMLGILLLLALFLVGCVWVSAQNQLHLTEVPEEEVVVVTVGGDVRSIFLNSSERYINGEKIVKQPKTGSRKTDSGPYTKPLGPFETMLWKSLGYRWVSAFYPFVRVHTFETRNDRLKHTTEVEEGDPLSKRIVRCPQTAYSLPCVFERPTYVKEVELPGDSATINLIIYGTYCVTNPITAIFRYNGQFEDQLDSAMRSVINNYCQMWRGDKEGNFDPNGKERMSYALFQASAKGADSLLVKCFDYIDGNFKDKKKVSAEEEAFIKKVVSVCTSEEYGVAVLKAYVEDWEISEGSKEILAAHRSVIIEERKADAAQHTARGRAAQWKEVAAAAKGQGGDPDKALDNYAAVRQSELGVDRFAELAKMSNLSVLVVNEKGGENTTQTPIMIDPNKKKPGSKK